MKKIVYFALFGLTSFICLFDSFTVMDKISFSSSFGLGVISISIGILFILLWMEFKEVALGTGILLWGIPITNAYEMSKDGESIEGILFFLLTRIVLGIVFYISVYESVEIAKSEFKKKRR